MMIEFRMAGVAAAILVAHALGLAMCGCSGSTRQMTLNTIADVALVETTAAREQYHERRDAHCRSEFPPETSTFNQWRECMEPSYRIDSAVASLDVLLRYLETLGQEDSDWRDAVRGAFEAAQELHRAYLAAGLPIHPKLARLIEALEAL